MTNDKAMTMNNAPWRNGEHRDERGLGAPRDDGGKSRLGRAEEKIGFAVQRKKVRYNRGLVNVVNIPIHRLRIGGEWSFEGCEEKNLLTCKPVQRREMNVLRRFKKVKKAISGTCDTRGEGKVDWAAGRGWKAFRPSVRGMLTGRLIPFVS